MALASTLSSPLQPWRPIGRQAIALGLRVCGRKFASDRWRLVYGLITDLAVPQVAHRAGLEQEDVVGVERRGPGRHFSGLGVELVSPPHLEEPGISFRADSARSVRTPLTHRNTIIIVLTTTFVNAKNY